MSKKSVPCQINIPKNTKQVSLPVTFILPHGIGQTKSRWKYYGNISKKTTMTYAFKMLKQMFSHTCFIPCIFPIIAFVTDPFKWNSSVVSPTYSLPQHLHVRRSDNYHYN